MQTIKNELNKYIDQIRELRESGMYVKDIAAMFNVSWSSMSHFLLENRILWRTGIGVNDYEIIIKRYNDGDSLDNIAKDYHVSPGTLSSLLKKLGVHIRVATEFNRKYTLNQSYFDAIDTPNKAYIVGLLLADGNVSPNKSMRLQLSISDKSILEKINEEIGSNRPLKIVEASKKK